ncbi:MAG TPA: hypothetical protein VI759_06490 [Dehalococcoidia bacterium]|nr:hypothetical protein [Dehalococcoidia bacterium]
MKKPGLTFVMRACPRCGGAAYLEDPREGDWRCLQCARPVAIVEIEARKNARPAA